MNVVAPSRYVVSVTVSLGGAPGLAIISTIKGAVVVHLASQEKREDTNFIACSDPYID